MLTLRLAWHSLFRHYRRTIITSIAISFGLVMLLVVAGINNDGHRKMIDQGVHLGSGHVVVQGKGYQAEQTLDLVIAAPASVIAGARRIPGVVETVPRVRASGLVAAGSKSSAVIIAGVDPAIEQKVSRIGDAAHRVSGEYLRSRAEMPFANMPADIYLGRELADKLGVVAGDRVVLTVTPRKAERPRSAAFVVRGTFRTGLDEFDAFYAEIPLDEAQALLGLDGSVSQVAIFLDDVEATGRVTVALRAALARDAEIEILPWQEALRELYEYIVIDDASMYITMGIIFAMVAIAILNTMLMSVIERTREFGIMMAIGTSGQRLFATVLTEALLLGTLASAVGLGIGLAIHHKIATTGIDIAETYGSEVEVSGVVMEGRIYSYLPTETVVTWALIVVGIAVASAVYPAWRAARLQPIEAMRHV